MSGALITLFGHLGGEPEERVTRNGDGTRVVICSVATTVWREGKEHTIWWRVNFWGNRFDSKLKFLKKGSAVVIAGELVRVEPYHKKDGNVGVSIDINATSLTLSPFGKKRSDEEEGVAYSDKRLDVDELIAATVVGDMNMDDIPF